jgi:predicted AAA+ superfamily ATPase
MMSEFIHKYRFIESILPSSKTRRLVIITGARQTGKTTLAQSKYPELAYINLDAPENRESIRSISSVSWGKNIGNAILDEAHKEPTAFEKVKYAYDGRYISFCLLLGSSQILLLKKIRESLAGRVFIYELWPLMMSEIFERQGIGPEPPFIDRFFSKTDFEHLLNQMPNILLETLDSVHRETEQYVLQWGGMPALLSLSNEERWKWLKDYEYTYLERDLSDLARLDDLVPFRTFQRLSALRSGKLLNYSELARDASLSIDTARRYLEYLRLSYQTILLHPYHKNITSTVIKTPKLYWIDVGLMRVVSGLREAISGEIYETMVISELFKWMKTMQRGEEVYFYRTRSGLELDLLLPTEAGIIGIEIKSRKTIVPSDLRAMREIAAGLKKEWRGGLIIYQGNEIKKLDNPRIWAIPSRRLFIL